MLERCVHIPSLPGAALMSAAEYVLTRTLSLFASGRAGASPAPGRQFPVTPKGGAAASRPCHFPQRTPRPF